MQIRSAEILRGVLLSCQARVRELSAQAEAQALTSPAEAVVAMARADEVARIAIEISKQVAAEAVRVATASAAGKGFDA